MGFEGGVESRVLSVGAEGREGLCKWKAEEGCGKGERDGDGDGGDGDGDGDGGGDGGDGGDGVDGGKIKKKGKSAIAHHQEKKKKKKKTQKQRKCCRTRTMAQSQEKKPHQGHKKKDHSSQTLTNIPHLQQETTCTIPANEKPPNDGKEKAIGDETTRNDFLN